jgi:uncharacterized protein YndB with AHSA1/START domain
MTETSTETTREIDITRVIDAPRERVFAAWTDPDQFAAWWGPEGYSSPRYTVAIDARDGGHWHATMISDTDETDVIPFFGVYAVVRAPERLVFSLVDPNDPNLDARPADVPEAVTITFEDIGGGRTKQVFHQSGHLTEEQLAKANAGWGSFFDCLSEYLARS